MRRAHARLLVFASARIRRKRIADVMPTGFAYQYTALLRQPVEPECGEEGVQQAGVVAVLHVLDIELPVARQHLAEMPEHSHRSAHDAPDARNKFLAEIAFERRHIRRERTEYESA